jgi:glutathione synthase/RimK-type ligase-like ATP-grasp enzyme
MLDGYHLDVARKIGFKIPHSLISNNPAEIKKFITENDCIIKPISHGLQISEEEIFSIYTHSIDKDLEFSLNELFETPVYVQEKIQNQFDIRVTVIGDKLFPVSIKKADLKEVDWRKPEISKEYHITELPLLIANKCFEINKKLGLSYSAIDLIHSANNEYTFLEVNPAGEWVWLEKELGLPISQKLIEELIKE